MIITHKLTIDEAKLGSSVKTNWKLSKVRAIVSKESEKAIRIDTAAAAAHLTIGFRKASSRLSIKKKTGYGLVIVS